MLATKPSYQEDEEYVKFQEAIERINIQDPRRDAVMKVVSGETTLAKTVIASSTVFKDILQELQDACGFVALWLLNIRLKQKRFSLSSNQVIIAIFLLPALSSRAR